jgi:hypothetical protein
MSSLRESLIADLVRETGLPDAEIRLVLNALAVKMNEEFRSSSEFEFPGVGKLMRIPESAVGTHFAGEYLVTELDLGQTRRAAGSETGTVTFPVPEQRTGHPPAIAEVIDDTEVPLRLRNL